MFRGSLLEITEGHLVNGYLFLKLTLLHRQKRVSDQIMADLQTKLALRKWAEQRPQVQVALGLLDPTKM